MMNWMLVSVKYTKQHDDGSFKRVNEPYLIQAESFTDSEARIYAEVGEFIRGEFLVSSIKRYDVNDIFANDESETWFKVVLEYDSLENEKSKRIKQSFLVSANSVDHADETIRKELKQVLTTFEIKSVVKTQIVDVFPLNSNQ
jgi:hypothetical protein